MTTCISHLIKCPKPDCQSLDIWKNGFDYQQGKKIQRYKCKKCGYIFNEGE